MTLFGIFGRSTPPAAPPEAAPTVVFPAAVTIAPNDPSKRAQTNYAAALLSHLAYENNETKVRDTLTGLGFTDIKLFGWDMKGTTQAIIARKGDVVTVTFRGTQDNGDVGANLPATNPEVDSDLSGNEVQGDAFKKAKVHRGFRDSLAELWDPDKNGENGQRLVKAQQATLLSTLQTEASKLGTQFMFTGHSLGGAQATLAATYVSLQNPARNSRVTMLPNVASVITFGSPKVGNEAFVTEYDKALGKVTRPFEHNNDIVRAMPPGLGYRQVGEQHLVKLQAADPANPPGLRDSHRMDNYVERMATEAAKEIAASSRPVAAAVRPRAFFDEFVAA